MKVVFVIGCCAAAVVASAQNLVLNGSFESPAIGSGFQVVSAGAPTIPHWFVDRTSVDIVSSTFAPTYPARDGVQSIDLAGTPGPGRVMQFFTTTPGADYIVRFSASSNGASNLMEVFWEGAILTTPATPAQGTWQDFQFILRANSSNGMIGFASLPDNNTNQGPMVDAVSVQLVPEPATWLLVALGLGAMARRRR